MTDWPGGLAAITLFAEDLPATRQFYLDVFGLPVVFEDESSAVFQLGGTLDQPARRRRCAGADRARPGR